MENKSKMYPPKLKIRKEKCYCCHKVKEGNTVFVDLSKTIEKVTNTEITNAEVRFVCYSCNHLKENYCNCEDLSSGKPGWCDNCKNPVSSNFEYLRQKEKEKKI